MQARDPRGRPLPEVLAELRGSVDLDRLKNLDLLRVLVLFGGCSEHDARRFADALREQAFLALEELAEAVPARAPAATVLEGQLRAVPLLVEGGSDPVIGHVLACLADLVSVVERAHDRSLSPDAPRNDGAWATVREAIRDAGLAVELVLSRREEGLFPDGSTSPGSAPSSASAPSSG